MPVTGNVGGQFSMPVTGVAPVGLAWAVLLEGPPVALVGVEVCFLFADRPSEGRWMNKRENILIEDVLATERMDGTSTGRRIPHWRPPDFAARLRPLHLRRWIEGPLQQVSWSPPRARDIVRDG